MPLLVHLDHLVRFEHCQRFGDLAPQCVWLVQQAQQVQVVHFQDHASDFAGQARLHLLLDFGEQPLPNQPLALGWLRLLQHPGSQWLHLQLLLLLL